MQQQDKDHAPAERKTRHDEKRLAGERGEARRPSSMSECVVDGAVD
jgi:hypothetical protein